MDLKNITGEVQIGKLANINLYGKITETVANNFNKEFDYLENVIHPSRIIVHINSEGGAITHGMAIYATIQNSSIKVDCIIEGIAASMASIIWAAGNNSFMRDYSILMIHNPFIPDAKDDLSTNEIVQAFTKQLETIYTKRFGLPKENVTNIMQGKIDGTFFDAKSTVEAGIIPSSNIIATSKQIREKVKNEISNLVSDIQSYSKIQSYMNDICSEINACEKIQHVEPYLPILEQNSSNMNDENKIEISAIAATLGLNNKAETKDVIARVTLLTSFEAKFNEAQKALVDAQTVIAGKDATIQNQQENIIEITTKLTQYEQKEATEKRNKIENLVAIAISEGKIEMNSKDNWIQMFESNFTLAENTLASIPGRDKISQEIADDPHNIQLAEDGMKSAEQQLADRISHIVGENFQFKKIN